MNPLSNFLRGAFFVLLFSPFFHQNLNGQNERICTKIGIRDSCPISTPESGPINISTVANNKATLRLDPNGADIPPTGWYKPFWIFGDGNFLHTKLQVVDTTGNNEVNSRKKDEKELKQDYVFGTQGAFQATVHLTERYSNTRPPKAARVIINTPSTLGESILPKEKTTLKGNPSLDPAKISIYANHQPRVNYPMVFAVSWRKDLGATHLVLFYNAAQAVGQAQPSPADVNVFSHSEWPNYFLDTAHVTELGLTSTLEGEQWATQRARYQNYISYDLTKIDLTKVNPRFKELRVFPVFKTNDLRENTVLMASKLAFEAQLYKNLFTDDVIDINIDLDNRARILALPPAAAQLLAKVAHTEKVLTSHDPNALTIDKITGPDGDGNYKIQFRLSICNDGPIPEDAIELEFSDLTNSLFKDLRIISTPTASFSADPGGSKWKAGLTNFLILPAPPGHYEQSCEDVLFTMETNETGKKLLLGEEEEQPIYACVRFKGNLAEQECTLNTPYPSDGKIDPPPADDWLWMILSGVGVLGLLGILFGFLKKKKKEEK